MKAIPEISQYMTTCPRTIGMDQTLAQAEEVMRELKIRHLPVLDGGKLVGLLSDRDVKMIQSFKDVNAEKVPVSEACSEQIYSVSPKAKLTEVCEEMAAKKYGSALVMDNHKLVGIFTWVDALNAMSELMHTRLKN